MLEEALLPYRKRRGNGRRAKKNAPSPTPPAGPLVLLSAEYEPQSVLLVMQFDREIELGEIDVAAFLVNDPQTTGHLLGGEFASRPSPNVLHLLLQSLDGATGTQNWLSVGADNGLIAIDGGIYPGVSELELPFP